MASKINDLTAVTSILATDITNIVRSPFAPGDDHKITLANLLSMSSVAVATGTGTTQSSTLNSFLLFGNSGVAVTGNTFALGVNSFGVFTINTANSGIIHLSAGGIDTITTGIFSPCTIIQSAVNGGTTASLLTATAGTIGSTTGWSATNKWDVKFDLSHTVTFANAVGDLTSQVAYIVTAPTYAYTSVAHNISLAATAQITGDPQQGSNATVTLMSTALLMGSIGWTSNVSSSGAITVLIPGITNGIGNCSVRTGIRVTSAGPFSLGDQTATLTLLSGISISAMQVTSTALTRTVTTGASFYIEGTFSSAGNVTFTNNYSFFVDAGNSRFDGNVLIGATSAGASMTSGISMGSATNPSGNVTDAFQFYANDVIAGNAAPHFRTENGSIIKLFTSSAYTITNVTTDRSYDANSTTLDEIADVLGTLISDLQATGLIG